MTQMPNETIEISREQKKQQLKKMIEVLSEIPENKGKDKAALVREITEDLKKMVADHQSKLENISQALKEYKKKALEVIKKLLPKNDQKKAEKEAKKKTEKEFEAEMNDEIEKLNEEISLWEEILAEIESEESAKKAA